MTNCPGSNAIREPAGVMANAFDTSNGNQCASTVENYSEMPERRKGIGFFSQLLAQLNSPTAAPNNGIFGGPRDDYSRAIITEQVYDIAAKYVRGNVDFDVENADWLVIPNFRMPTMWKVPTSPLMIYFPTNYPAIAPIGFYLPQELTSPNGHKYNQAYHHAAEAPTMHGWSWYCCTVNEGAWRPYPARHEGEWRRGDNLWTYITLINEVLGSPLHAD